MSSIASTDVVILGAGIVGLSVAWQLLEREITKSITVVDKEPTVGLHGSGRNSGVLHAGLYYKPGTVKAKVCVTGANRLKSWCREEGLTILESGKVITPQREVLDSQLEVLLERGRKNGAEVELIDEKQFFELCPSGRTATGRALWSPGTSVVKPIDVVQRLKQRLEERGVTFLFGKRLSKILPVQSVLMFSDDSSKLSYGHLFNCSGLHVDRVAHDFGVAKQYTMLPFRGNYWQLAQDAPFAFTTNLYPVPDLEVPFLGVHVTPSVDGVIYFGPTAIPAIGREHYRLTEGVEFIAAFSFLHYMAIQLIKDKKMRRYVAEQAFDWMPSRFLKAVKQIVPEIKREHLVRSNKAGIRPQLYDRVKHELVQDFVMLSAVHSTHIINAISPAFTASFELADYILDNSNYDL